MHEEKAKILVVDDDIVFQKLMQTVLSNYGYIVKSVYNGEEALNEVNIFLPDIILLDIIMPNGMDGHEVCKQFKKNNQMKNIPIILVSASSEEVDKVKGFSIGAVDYIHKPFPRQEILARIGMHLKNSESYIKRKRIEKVIEFPPEYYQAGVGILNYFAVILSKRYPKQKVGVTLKQEDLKVTMIIETPDGKREEIEKALYDYGLVVNGKKTPQQFSSDKFLVIGLENELTWAKAQIETNKRLVCYQDEEIKRKDIRIDKLLLLLEAAFEKPICVDVSPQFICADNVKFVSGRAVVVGGNVKGGVKSGDDKS